MLLNYVAILAQALSIAQGAPMLRQARTYVAFVLVAAFAMSRRRAVMPTPFLENRGPENLTELSQWDEFIVQKAMSAGLAGRMVEMLMGGCIMNSDYSGADFTRESVRIIMMSMYAAFGLPLPPTEHVRSCDWGALQMSMLKKQSKMLSDSRGCVFENMLDRLPLSLQQWLTDAAPNRNDNVNKARKANADIWEHLNRNASWAFPPTSSSYCQMHKHKCPTYPGTMYTPSHSAFFLELPDEQPQPKRACRRYDSDVSSVASLPGLYEPWWAQRRVVPRMDDGSCVRPLIVNIAGVTCLEYTSLGKQKRDGGCHDLYHSVWSLERQQVARQGLEDVYFSECADRYPAESLQVDKFSETHCVVVLRTCPSQMGFPIRRRRRYTAGLNKQTCIWVGPSTQEDVNLEFQALFHRTLELTGDTFFVADEGQVLSWVLDRTAKRKTQSRLPDTFGTNMETYFQALVPQGGVQRKSLYDALRQTEGGLAGAFLIDIEQNPHQGSVPGPVVPALCTHSDIFSYESQRFAIACEYLAMQGADSHSKLSGGRGISKFARMFETITESETRHLVGNGIHIAVFAAWFVYVMGNTIRREIPTIAAPLRTRLESNDDVEDETAMTLSASSVASLDVGGVADSGMTTQASLAALVGSLRLIPTSERQMEAQHAKTHKRGLGRHNHTAVDRTTSKDDAVELVD
jgi:hypothetical protein